MSETTSLKGKSNIFVEEEYAAQIHDVSTQTVYQNALEIVEDTIDEALDGLWSIVSKICPECELKTAGSIVKKAYLGAIEKHSPEILESVQETLFIPHNVLLPENEAQKHQYSLSEYGDIIKKNAELKSQVFRNSKLKNALALEVPFLENVELLESKLTSWGNLFKTVRSEIDEAKKRVEFINGLFNNVFRVNSGVKKKNPYSIKNALLSRIDEI